ncbi:MAG: polysaccharide pyruvyl transferase family protein [Phycisphaerae bacterium]|nr:polysaccharide pyruvyl transferase family protein [Phycisphaerae bacterium]
MKTVGTMAIHYVDNHGGVLLAYALQESVERLGYECRVIDFDPTRIPSLIRHVSRGLKRRLMRTPVYLHYFGYYAAMCIRNGVCLPPRHGHQSVGVRKTNFDCFRRRYIKLSERRYTSSESLEDSPPPYDAFVCGSDQIWNPYICKPAGEAWNERAYFLTFAAESKRVAYAPSIAIPSIPGHLREEMASMLRGIPHLSVREIHGARLIKEMTGREARVVLDPTLLLSQECWDKVAVEPGIKEPYVLAYYLGESAEYRTFAYRLAEKARTRVVLISRVRDEGRVPHAIPRHDVGPAEFLGLIKRAECICTDSFHGTLFSINYRRPFYTFERPGSSGAKAMSSRIHSILNLCGLTAQLVQSHGVLPSDPFSLDYTGADVVLQRERSSSLRYLRESLESATCS